MGVNSKTVLVSLAGIAVLATAIWFLLPDPEEKPETDTATVLSEAQELQRQKEFLRAARKFEEVLRKDPEAYDALVGLGLTWQAMGYDGRSVEILARAVKNRVGKLSLDRAFARALLATGQREKAIEILESAYRKSRDPKTGLLLGDAYYEAGRFEDAGEQYLDLLMNGVRSSRLVLRLHRTLLINKGDAASLRARVNPSGDLLSLIESAELRWKGDLAGAIERLDGDSPVFSRRKLKLLLEMGKYEEVLPLADRLQRKSRDRDSITFRADAGMAKMLALLLLNRLSEAREFAALQLQELDLQVTAIRGAVASFRHVAGKTKDREFLAEVSDEPGLARNDHHLLLAVLARAEGHPASYRAFLEQAHQATIALNDPVFLIERLRKSTD